MLCWGECTIAELELHDIAYCGDDGVGDVGELSAANDDRNDLILAAVRACCIDVRINKVYLD